MIIWKSTTAGLIVLLSLTLSCSPKKKSSIVDPTNDTKGAYPIVLQHGLMDGGLVTPFKNIQIELNKLRPTFSYEVSPADHIAVRGKELAANIDKVLASTGAAKVNIIALSMGGLDARYAISTLKYGNRVATLTTVSTPHRGTPIADQVTNQKAFSPFLSIFSSLAGLTGDNVKLKNAIADLSEEYVTKTFNPQNLDDSQVKYQSWGAISGIGSGDSIKAVLLPGWSYIKDIRGPNDGLVPVSSAKWGTFKGTIVADHIDLSDHSTFDGLFNGKFDAIGFYKKIVADLVSQSY